MELMPMMKHQLKQMINKYKSRVSIMSLQKVQIDTIVEIKKNIVARSGNGQGIALVLDTALICENIARNLVVNI